MKTWIHQAEFIAAPASIGTTVPCFSKKLTLKEEQEITKATLQISALGVYEADIDGNRIGQFRFAPGWTEYGKRVQFQSYDVTGLVHPESVLNVLLGDGWYAGRIGRDAGTWWEKEEDKIPCIIAALVVEYADGTTQIVLTDSSWQVLTTPILFSDMFDGETVDFTKEIENLGNAVVLNRDKTVLIPQEGEEIREIMTLSPAQEIITHKGERVLDFGQNLTGTISVCLSGKRGDKLELSFGEVLDKDGNFYNENYRSAKNKILVTLPGQTVNYAPLFAFQGFRYVRLDQCPKETTAQDFAAVVIHSDMERTGDFSCGVELVNRLYNNIVWGQRGNFLDIPTDCPQRDERKGWLGDAQVFCRTASYNFKVDKFFRKWLHDMVAAQDEQGRIPHIVPNAFAGELNPSAAWADAATIIPLQMVLTYGDLQFAVDQFDCAKRFVDYVHGAGHEEFLWLDGTHFGDWLGLDAPYGSYKGSTDEGLIASAYFALSTENLVKLGKYIGKDMTEYEALYKNIVRKWNETYVTGQGRVLGDTQTGYALALVFDLVENKQPFADRLAALVRENGNKLKTGFVGTPYILKALSDNGYTDVAYSLLLQIEFPSWLYPVTMGATTIWEHWDGIRPDGSMWSVDMNSYNHYAYGAVYDWLFGEAVGIAPDPENPGFKHILFTPHPDKRLGFAKASLKTKYGLVAAGWRYEDDVVRYEFTVPDSCTATVTIDGKAFPLSSGSYLI